VQAYSFTLTQRDPDRPWIVVSRKHQTVELDDSIGFFEWARSQSPEPRSSVELDPWQLSRGL